MITMANLGSLEIASSVVLDPVETFVSFIIIGIIRRRVWSSISEGG